jgi:hypothetical protein
MVEQNISGYWKGLAISRSFQINIHVFLEQKGDALTGKFETNDPEARTSHGSLSGSVRGTEVIFNSEDKTIEFRGQLLGETNTDYMLFGTLKSVREKSPTSTLTLFPGHSGIVAFNYIPPPP